MAETETGARALPIVLVAAMGRNRVIGRDGDMPWRLPSDLKHFKALTLGQPVVMGRRTFLSIGRPLPGRTNVVVSGPSLPRTEGIERTTGLDEALRMADRLGREAGARMVAVIGGGQVYEQTIDLADRLEITHVDAAPDGDVFFPEIDPAVWREAARSDPVKAAGDTAPVVFATYLRR